LEKIAAASQVQRRAAIKQVIDPRLGKIQHPKIAKNAKAPASESGIRLGRLVVDIINQNSGSSRQATSLFLAGNAGLQTNRC